MRVNKDVTRREAFSLRNWTAMTPVKKQTMHTDVLILGGGITGLQSAVELSRMGLDSVVVERVPFPGGHVAHFACKATDRCQRCGACVLEDILQHVKSSSAVRVQVRTEVERIDRCAHGFSVSLFQRPVRIIPDVCSECGKCEEVCPMPGAVIRSPLDQALSIDESRCRFFHDRSCNACSEVCPESAVDLHTTGEEIDLTARATIIATGFKPFDASEKARFGHGIVPGVVTSLELDTMVRDGTRTLWPNGKEPRSIAFIQCVGSRDATIGRNYCSRVCCANALRMAKLLKSRIQGLDVTLFYMDLQNFDRDYDKRIREAEQEVALVRSIPAEIRKGQDRPVEIIYHGRNEERVTQAVDLVVLSIGMSPPSVDFLQGLAVGSEGFVGEEGRGVRTNMDGVFVAGAARGPKSIEESLADAVRVAGAVSSYLRQDIGGGSQ